LRHETEIQHVGSGGHQVRLALMAGGIAALHALGAHAQEGKAVEFDAGFLPGGSSMSIDLARFRRGNAVLPGLYDVDIWLNDEWQGRRSVRFVERRPGTDATPCLSRNELEGFGLMARAVAGGEDACEPIGLRVVGAVARLDVAEQRLAIDVPQAMLVRRRRSMAPRDQWRDGIVAGLLDWRLNLQDTSSQGRRVRSVYFSDESGLNGGRWRLRHAGSFSGSHYRPTRTYAQRAVVPLAASLRAGEFSTGGDLFEPIALRGVELSSDPRMNAAGAVGYVPTVSGIAGGHARVRITQGGTLLRELTVPAGPFVVDDLQASGRGGDMVVEVEEDSGRRTRYRVPFFAMPELLREGEHRFSLLAGRLRSHGPASAPIVQATWRHGMSHGLTLYGGTRWISRGTWVMAGTALDTLIGAFSFEGTRARPRGGGRAGPTWRGHYGTRWRDGSLVSLHVTQGATRRSGGAPRRGDANQRQRQVELLFQRTLASGSGAIGVGVSHGWSARGGSEVDHMLTWSRMWGAATFDFSLRRSRRRVSKNDVRAKELEGQLSVSATLGRATASPVSRLAWRTVGGKGESQASVTGVAGDEREWAYAVSAARNRAAGPRVDASLSRPFRGGDIGWGISKSRESYSASLSAAGAMVVHAGGVTLAPQLGESMALVRARHATGARLASSTASRVDRHGYAVVPNLVPFRWNNVDIDPAGLALDVHFASTHTRVAPTAGAIVLVPFDTESHPTVLLSGRMADGAPLPFGAEVVDGKGRSMGLVGQRGQALVRWEADPTPITVRWSGEDDGSCLLSVTSVGRLVGLNHHEGICR
jgi:outer membrane usher protein